MITKFLEMCIAMFIIVIIAVVVVLTICIAVEFSEDIADWIREKVFKKKRGAK